MLYHQISQANQTLNGDLDSLEQMVNVFSEIFELDIATQAKQVRNHLLSAANIYFEETWDSSEVVTSSLDWTFSKLDFETSKFSDHVDHLVQAIRELEGIYAQFILSQTIVILVSSLEVYLSTVFKTCLSNKPELNEYDIRDIVSCCNFQNWGSSVHAFRTFLGVELTPQGIDVADINAILQKRHVLVHRMGLLDERAVRQLNLRKTREGERLEISSSEALESIRIVRRISKHLLSQFTSETTWQ